MNGSILLEQVDATGLAASTVNGDIDVRMRELGTGDLEYSTVNGSIESDYPLTVQGRIDRRRIEATLGNGGPRIEARTVNGSVTLKRGS